MDDKQKIEQAMRALFATFNVEANANLLRGYLMGVADLSAQDIQVAIARAICECTFLPKPVELRKLTGSYIDHETRAQNAWNDVQRALPLGSYKHVDFQDKLCNAVIRNLGGWVAFVSRFTDAESEKWTRLEFVKTYKSFASSSVSGDMLEPLAGLSEASVRNGVVSKPVPVRIACDENRVALPCVERPRVGFIGGVEPLRIERQLTQ